MGLSAVSLGDAEGTATVNRAMASSVVSVGDSVGAAAILRGLGFNAISLGNNLGAATIDRAMRFGLITLGDALGSTEGEVPVGTIETSPGIVVAIQGEYVWVQLVPEYFRV